MNNEHPITPPTEGKFKQWEDDILNERENVDVVLDCTWKDGYRAGADAELEACCLWLSGHIGVATADILREARRRPKPPSLKKQALAELEKVDMLWDTSEFGAETLSALDTIRRALEALPE